MVKVKDKFQVTIPNEIRLQAHIKEGDILEVVIQDKAIVFKPGAVLDRDSGDAAIAEGLRDYLDASFSFFLMLLCSLKYFLASSLSPIFLSRTV
ncbi:AbrB/MazE/SpoVT family DNA-binding domain-containing protein [Candidatus Magnetominusculus dajiuhuensis]|uniref:AbrB/MazE/SpoVT family DNA-binding domain-containing protein n=1 Tax=Candidatus Magnetominusculus dajiuhuensis TaxID=3137712 RepID=UPI003B430DA0